MPEGYREKPGPDELEVRSGIESIEVTATPEILDEQEHCLVEFNKLPRYDSDALGTTVSSGVLSCAIDECRLNSVGGDILIVRPDQVPAVMALRCRVWNQDPSNVVNVRPIPNEMLPQDLRPEPTE